MIVFLFQVIPAQMTKSAIKTSSNTVLQIFKKIKNQIAIEEKIILDLSNKKKSYKSFKK